ncbi:MAG: signal peptidase [Chloroflexi bacterium]|nr:signal peptidase [Chloroflexota bacterium]MDB5076631.1 signal peptidase [Chloroflexota bacterium]
MRLRSSRIVEIVKTLAITALLYLGIQATVSPRVVDGQSMEPTLHNQEWIMLDKVSYMFHAPQRGDVIVFKYPFNPTQDYIKRIIGVPGDHVVVGNGHVYVNGQQLSERYIAAAPNYTDSVTVPQGFLYVLGDNRDNSSDSHVWGLLPRANVEGRAMFSYWPIPDLTFLHQPSYVGLSHS